MYSRPDERPIGGKERMLFVEIGCEEERRAHKGDDFLKESGSGCKTCCVSSRGDRLSGDGFVNETTHKHCIDTLSTSALQLNVVTNLLPYLRA